MMTNGMTGIYAMDLAFTLSRFMIQLQSRNAHPAIMPICKPDTARMWEVPGECKIFCV
jgi:hypothetical protein